MPRRSLSFLAVAAVMSGCGGAATSSTVETASPTTSSISITPTPSPDPVANPSIEGSFAVADDGRELALICWGEGSPTVVLETGGTNIEEWSSEPLVPTLAQDSRVCTYDRAGTGGSDPAPNESVTPTT